MNLQGWTRKAVIFYIFGVVQVIILSIFAMLFYTGGTRINPFTSGYTFWMNYISDLGRSIAYSGVPNTVSQIFFIIMELIWVSTFIVLLIFLSASLIGSQKRKWLGASGGISAVISGLVLIGTVLSPEDIYPELHMVFALGYYLTMALMAIFIALAIIVEKKFSIKYAILFIILALFLLIYAIISLIGLNFPLTSELLILYVVGQKVITYTLLAATCVISYGMWKLSIKNS